MLDPHAPRPPSPEPAHGPFDWTSAGPAVGRVEFFEWSARLRRFSCIIERVRWVLEGKTPAPEDPHGRFAPVRTPGPARPLRARPRLPARARLVRGGRRRTGHVVAF